MKDLISRQAAIKVMRKAKDKSELHRMLIQLPSAQPSVSKTETVEDCISRQAAIDEMHKIGFDYCMCIERYQHNTRIIYENNSITALLNLPSVQSEQRWIPWDSGKFPEESGTYTVTAYDGAKRRVTYAKYQKRLKRWELTGARAYWRVIAWMPLPTPYREGGRNA